jgi:hypothetical protein
MYTISVKKTLISDFETTANGIKYITYKDNDGKFEIFGKLFAYLGLSFDGQRKFTFYQSKRE